MDNEEINIEALKERLRKIYKQYLDGKMDAALEEEIREVYIIYHNLDNVIERNMAIAINYLVNIGWHTGIKRSKEEIKKILENI